MRQHSQHIPQGFAWNNRIGSVFAGWTYSASSKRDLRLDLLRGFCVFVMIIDHIGGLSPLRAITGGNTFFVSAAEGFVFISGLLLGEIYRKIAEREGLLAVFRKAIQRAGRLYLLTFVLTLLFTYGAWLINSPWANPHRDEIAHPLRFAMRVLTMRRSYAYTDIFVMYTLLILGAPLVVWLLQRGQTGLLLLGSWSLWGLYQFSPPLASQPLPTINMFHPAAWQIFFVHAMALGYHKARIATWYNDLPHSLVFASSLALFGLLLAVYLTQGMLLLPYVEGDPATFVQTLFLKNPVRIGRIIAALIVFPLAFMLVTYCWAPLRKALGWLLLPLGEYSLYTYTMHLPLMIIFATFFSWASGVTFEQQLINAATQLGAVLIVWLMIRYRFLFSVVPT
jgi:hypothetical protein